MGKLWGGLFAMLSFALVLGAAGAGEDEAKGKVKIDFDVFFSKLDMNKDGKLSKDEFLRLAERAKDKERARDKLSQAFDKIDPRNAGITKEQFKRFLEQKKSDK